MQPEAAHLAPHVSAQIGEVSILGADQVGPVARRDVSIPLVLSLIADAGHWISVGLSPERSQNHGREAERRQNWTDADFHGKTSVATKEVMPSVAEPRG
jgi:hypothetical protein